jgi:hypothetical protein
MTRGFRIGLISALCALVLVVGNSAPAERLVIGVNRPNQAWLSSTDWKRTLMEMQRAGVQDLRLTVSRPLHRSIESVVAAYEAGFRVLLSFQLTLPDYYPPTAERREAFRPRFHRPYKLSDIDVGRFLRVWTHVHDELNRRQVVLAGVEIGNEINWGGFNGDLPVGPHARLFASKEELNTPTGRTIVAGFDRVAEIVAAVAKSDRQRKYSLLVGALSPRYKSRLGNAQVSSVELGLALQLLEERGVMKAADGVSLHYYYALGAGRGAEQCPVWDRHWIESIGFCRRDVPNSRSCWITETGARTEGFACEPDGPRVRLFSCLRDELLSLSKTFRIEHAYVFAWDTPREPTRLSLFRNGQVCGEARVLFPIPNTR